MIFPEEKRRREEGGKWGEGKGKGKREEEEGKEQGGREEGGRREGVREEGRRLTSAGEAGRHAGDTRAGTFH